MEMRITVHTDGTCDFGTSYDFPVILEQSIKQYVAKKVKEFYHPQKSVWQDPRESLPTSGDYVIVSCYEYRSDDFTRPLIAHYDTKDMEWYSIDGSLIHRVIAWMYIPTVDIKE